MDEDDSQDELINRSSKSKGKRAATWAISDDSDDARSDEDKESESFEDEEEHIDGEDDDDEFEEEEDEEEEEEEDYSKLEKGASAGTSAEVEMSSDEEAEKCPICLHSFNRQPVATPENCEHYFCLDCILEWSKNANSCPIDRTNFKVIYLRTCYGGKVQKMITVQKPTKQGQQDVIDVNLEETTCEVCGASDREDRLLLCDGCDAGYHMECLTPPLDAVPVEEWFCPECEANNRQSRGSATEISDTESLPSTTRPASSHSRSRTGHTRAIARTQHSERVRANVNRHRITQARTQELAPTYLIRSTWLDETINAVVAGLNTAVYVRDLTSRSSATRRNKRRKGRKTSSKSKNGKAASTGARRRKRRRTKSKKKMVSKKTATSRGRIASSLGIIKDKKSSSLPTVYRPSENTLSSMRADIGAASLSIYGDPFDLDPFTDREDDEQSHDSSLLEAKRRGISRSAFRSHQPVARPVSLSRRSVSIPQTGSVVEAAPVPDLLGSILSGQSMLLMDSSDVVINRDGSLKATKPMSLKNALIPSSSGEGGPQSSPGLLPDHVDTQSSSDTPLNRHFSSTGSPIGPISNHCETTSHSHVVSRGNPSLPGTFSHEHNRPNQRLGHQITNGVRECREMGSSLSHLTPDSSKSKISSQSLKAPTKPMWMDVSVLPRIPKIKRDNSVDDTIKSDININRNGSSRSSVSANSYPMPETGINRLAGDKERRHSVDQHPGRAEGPRNRPDVAGSSSGFSSSFSSSSSSGASHTNHQRYSTSSSSSSVSFRINASGNSWHSRRLNIASLPPSGSSLEQCKQKDDEERKRQLHRDKQKLLASRSSNNIYDPFNPTESDSDSSDGDGIACSSRLKQESSSLKNKHLSSKQGLSQVKVEKQSPHSQNKPDTTAQATLAQQQKCTKGAIQVKKESRFSHIGKQNAPVKLIIKEEPEPDADEALNHGLHSELEDNIQHSQQKRGIKKENLKQEPSLESFVASDHKTLAASGSSPVTSQVKAEVKSESDSKSPLKDSGNEKKTSKKHVPSNNCPPQSSSLVRDRRLGSPKRDRSQGSPVRHPRQSSPKRDRSQGSPERDRCQGSQKIHQSQGSPEKVRRKDCSEKERRQGSQERYCSKTDRKPISPKRDRRQGSQEREHSKRDRKQGSPDRDRRQGSQEREHSKRDRRRQSPEKDRKQGHCESKHGGSQQEKDKTETSRRSRSKEKTKMHIVSDSSQSKSPDRISKKRRRSRSRSLSKDRRRSRSSSSSSSRERSRVKKHKKQIREIERNEDMKRHPSKDKKHDGPRSLSQSKSRSRSRSKERRRGRSHSKSRSRSRSRSREKRKDDSHYRSSRDKVESRTKEMKKHRSRSSSREKKERPVMKAQKRSDASSSSETRQDKKTSADKRKDETSVKTEKALKTNKPDSCPSTSISQVKKEPLELKGEEATEAVDKNNKTKKEIKKEKSPTLDMFEDSPINNLIKMLKKEKVDSPITELEAKCKEETQSIKTEMCESDPFQANSPEKCPDVSDSTISPYLTAVSSLLHDTPEPCAAEVPTNSVKQESHQPSDSDDDFNVDVMLDNLDLVKTKSEEGTEAAVKQEKEEKNEGEPALVGTKSKTQVKRVTWNIQEPVGPQPDKSASKVALYKLKLKQEGIRRPSSSSTSSQDLTGTAVVTDVSTAGVDPQSLSRSDRTHPPSATVQGEADDGDLLKKDRYLKKLHMQERAIEEVKLAIKPFYQRRDINKDEYKEILRKAVQKVCHSKSGEINPVKVGNLVKAYVDKYKHSRKHKKGEDSGKSQGPELMKASDSP